MEGCHATSRDDWRALPELLDGFGEMGCDVVQMVLADQDSWDWCAAAQGLNIRRWLDANPGDELAGQMRAELRDLPEPDWWRLLDALVLVVSGGRPTAAYPAAAGPSARPTRPRRRRPPGTR